MFVQKSERNIWLEHPHQMMLLALRPASSSPFGFVGSFHPTNSPDISFSSLHSHVLGLSQIHNLGHFISSFLAVTWLQLNYELSRCWIGSVVTLMVASWLEVIPTQPIHGLKWTIQKWKCSLRCILYHSTFRMMRYTHIWKHRPSWIFWRMPYASFLY